MRLQSHITRIVFLTGVLFLVPMQAMTQGIPTPTPIVTTPPTPTSTITPGVAVGRDWALATCNAPWGKRAGFACAYLQGRLWLIGGLEQTGSEAVLRNDVWYSTDGRDWTRVTEHGPFDPVRGHRLIAHQDKLWIIGGVNDAGTPVTTVWKSTDAVASTWVEQSPDP